MFKAIGEAQERIILETFIWFEDNVGKQLHAALLAAQRGVKAEVLLDGYGSPHCSDEFVNELTAAGECSATTIPALAFLVCAPMRLPDASQNCGDPRAYRLYSRAESLRRAYVQSYGPEAKQDYAVRLEGPIVEDILQFELENLPGQSAARRRRRRHHKAEETQPAGEKRGICWSA